MIQRCNDSFGELRRSNALTPHLIFCIADDSYEMPSLIFSENNKIEEDCNSFLSALRVKPSEGKFLNTVEPQWLKHLWDHANSFET